MTLMGKAADGVTWHAIDTVNDFRLGACGEPLDLGRQVHHSLIADHLWCQRPACSSARPQGTARPFAEAGEATVAGLVLLAVVLVVAVLLGAVVPLAVWPWLAYGGLALFVSGCFMAPRRR